MATARAKSLGASLVLALAASGACAQLVAPDSEWRETDVPAPPSLRTQGLIPLDMGRGTDMRWGVDPQSISIGADRVVRYVVVALGEGGALTAIYEGIRCNTADVRVYARHARDGQWTAANDDWKPLRAGNAQRHSLRIARDGACQGAGANGSPAQIARDLASPPNTHFRNESR